MHRVLSINLSFTITHKKGIDLSYACSEACVEKETSLPYKECLCQSIDIDFYIG